MNKPITIALFLFAILFLSIASPLWAQDEQPIEIIFAPGTTLAQADTTLAPYNLTILAGFQWTHAFGNETWGGGIKHTPGVSDINTSRNQHWQQYIQIITSMEATLTRHLQEQQRSGSVHPNLQNQYEETAAEQERLQRDIAECWDTNTCPSFQIVRVDASATVQVIEELSHLPIVEHVIQPTAFEQTAFFLERIIQQIWHTLRRPQLSLQP